LTALVPTSAKTRQGIYAFEPRRDLPALVRLLQVCFHEEIEAQDERWLTDIGEMAGGNLIFGLLTRLVPPGSGSMAGLVWYESGRLVGNVSLMRLSERSWVIANVATHPHFRRRGIGRQLMVAAIDRLRQRGAELAGLQVRVENQAAQALYRGLGFERVGAQHAYRAPLVAPPVLPAPDSAAVREIRATDLAAARAVAEGAGAWGGPWPPGPLRLSLERSALTVRVDDWLRGRSRRIWIAEDCGQPCGVAVAFIEKRGGTHMLELAVLPEARDIVSVPLLERVLEAIAEAEPLPVAAEVAAGETPAAKLLLERGFRHVRTLERLQLKIQQSGQ
jgi:ribosomal protein S18 acetylase RimI-like enzyme